MNAADRLIVALDGDAAAMGAVFLRLHRETPVRWFKVGPQLLLQHSGMIFIENMLREGDVNLMYDGKIYDTADTVRNVVSRAFNLGVHFVTVHATPSVMEAAMRAKPADARLKVLAVGPLSDGSVTTYNRWLENAEINLCDGVICPAAYTHIWASHLHHHSKLIVSPGVRPLILKNPGTFNQYIDASPDDHTTVISPKLTIQYGADYLVVGRPIWQSEDPVAAALAILAEMEAAL